ncbi:MAG: hypothetical protein AB7F99_19885 [Vicinamibacterales bacterium]
MNVEELVQTIEARQKRVMELRRELADYEAKRQELNKLESELRMITAVLQGHTAGLIFNSKPKSRHGFVGGKRAKPIQKGSSVWWSAKVLFNQGKPMHINEILKRIARESGETFKKPTVVSNLSRYVKYGDTFNRPMPNVFGLIDFTKDPDPSEVMPFGFVLDEEGEP